MDAAVIFVFLFLAVVGISDWKERKVPNRIVLLFFLLGLVIKSGIFPGSGGFALKEGGIYLISCLIVPVVMMPLFLCRMTGAGDLKAAGIVCGYLGIKEGITVLVCGLSVAFFVSLWKLLKSGKLVYRCMYFLSYVRQEAFAAASGNGVKELTAYYDAERDGDEWAIPLTFYFWIGAVFAALPGIIRWMEEM